MVADDDADVGHKPLADGAGASRDQGRAQRNDLVRAAPADTPGEAEVTGAGVDASPIFWTVSCFLQRESPSVRARGMTANFETIATSMAFKSGQAKNKRFLRNQRTESTFSGGEFVSAI